MNILLDLIFPPRCVLCQTFMRSPDRSGICSICHSAVSYMKTPLCRICGVELAGDAGRNHLCGVCLVSVPPFFCARSIVKYEAAVRELLQRLKYMGDMTVATAIRGITEGVDVSLFNRCDVIIPVPLHFERLRSRGFNQSLFLAKIIFADHHGRIRPDWLRRMRSTTPQTGLSGMARRKNLKNAFHVRGGTDIAGSRVCLVDDVFTTGTTVSECSRALLQAGAVEVRVVTLARTRV